MIRRGFTLIELAVSIGILVVVMLAAITVFLYSKSITTISAEHSLAKHGAELMLDLVRADAGGVPNFSDHYITYGSGARLAFGYDTAAPQDSILNPAPFGWTDPVNGRARLRNGVGWLFAAIDADERTLDAVPWRISEDLFRDPAGPFPTSGTGVDINGDADQNDDNGQLNANGYTGDLMPVTIVVCWDTNEAGSGPAARTYKLRTLIARED